MKDEELIKAYTISIFILAFLNEYEKHERFHSFARVYNIITKKNGYFQQQLDDLKRRKRKKVSHKAKLFFRAIGYSEYAWNIGISRSKELTVSPGAVVSCLYTRNSDLLNRIYGFDIKDFQSINKQSEAGVTRPSCVMSKILTDAAIDAINTTGPLKRSE